MGIKFRHGDTLAVDTLKDDVGAVSSKDDAEEEDGDETIDDVGKNAANRFLLAGLALNVRAVIDRRCGTRGGSRVRGARGARRRGGGRS